MFCARSDLKNMSEPLYLQLVPNDLNLEPLGTILTLFQKKRN